MLLPQVYTGLKILSLCFFLSRVWFTASLWHPIGKMYRQRTGSETLPLNETERTTWESRLGTVPAVGQAAGKATIQGEVCLEYVCHERGQQKFDLVLVLAWVLLRFTDVHVWAWQYVHIIMSCNNSTLRDQDPDCVCGSCGQWPALIANWILYGHWKIWPQYIMYALGFSARLPERSIFPGCPHWT